MLFTKPFYITKYLGIFKIERSPIKICTEKRNFSVLSFRTKGNTSFNQNGNVTTVKDGDVVFVPPNTEYTQSSSVHEKITAIHFKSNYPIFDRITPVKLQQAEKYFELIFKAASIDRSENSFEEISLLYRLLQQIENSFDSARKNSYPKILSSALEIFKNEFSTPETYTSSVAERLSVSCSYLRKLFNENLGISPSDYLLKIRMDNAKRLLESGYYKISEISALCGYAQPKSFTVAFKKSVGIPPTEFRLK